MKIMLYDETPERSLFLRMTLERLGHDIVAEIADAGQLYDAVRRLSPDAIIIDTDSPTRDTLEHLCLITESCPRPSVMFTRDAKRESIREAVRAGVTAYVVDGLPAVDANVNAKQRARSPSPQCFWSRPIPRYC